MTILFNSSPLRYIAGLCILLGMGGSHAMAAEAPDSNKNRIQRIEKLLGQVQSELDSLKRESAVEKRPDNAAPAPIAGSMVSGRTKTLAKANQTEMRSLAAGYTFNQDLPMGMHFLRWQDPWGYKLEGGAIITDRTRLVGLSATALWSIHRFNGLDFVETHLYALGGSGYFWERVLWETNIAQPWYETPDRWVRGQLGVGTEFTFFEIGGVRLSPETGLQADKYLSRYQNSSSFVFGSVPKSDFSLEPFFAFHLSFYFR